VIDEVGAGHGPATASRSGSPAEHPGREVGRWTNHGTITTVYESWWARLTIDDVEKPDGSRVEHEVVEGPDAAGLVVVHPDRGVLMIWRHRFIPDGWGWEIPGGAVDRGEGFEAAARRECLEETGWEPLGPLEHLSRHHPSCGFARQTFDLSLARDAVHRGEPSDRNEAATVAWRSLPEVSNDLCDGSIIDGFTQLGLALALIRLDRADDLHDEMTGRNMT
jgi:8-oxo-dGTP pyrophosphatase MutT (NUDIX family)